MQQLIRTILIANRSEIALRIIATCRVKGIETVAVYTQEDAFSPHVLAADFAFKLPKSGTSGYLDKDALIKIAQDARADAIHPGYGFLAENADFAQKVIDAGLTWIGPKPGIIHLMGNKIEARNAMIDSGMPVVPGAHCCNKNEAAAKAREIGFPVIIKAALGGGGKAMRRVESADSFETAYETVERESEKFFLSKEIFIEKYIEQGRHIEVQVAGDGTNAVHFFERECSIQRRHQKVIEEAPCAFVRADVLSAMHTAAAHATQSIGYDSIGTFEFIVTSDEKFYFLEMNTRLQVEHGVTELTTGLDLVDIQIDIARTKKLSLTQQDIRRTGHAIECRILAEDAYDSFKPSSGTITSVHIPSMPQVRNDHALTGTTEITPYFDSMIAKTLAWGVSRTQASARMLAALNAWSITGVATNIPFLAEILKTETFVQGNFSTTWLSTYVPESPSSAEQETRALLALLTYEKHYQEAVKPSTSTSTTNFWKRRSWR
jgi:acetyl-CoA carboxylase biotin carboxylase subunit